MISRIMRAVGWLVVNCPGMTALFMLAVTVGLYLNIHNLRTGTDLTDLFGGDDPQWRAASNLGKELGYGNQLYVLVEANSDSDTEALEEAADRLTGEMQSSGLFKHARCGLSEEEAIQMVRFFSENFPGLTAPEQVDAVRKQLRPEQIRSNVAHAAAELVTPFSPMGAEYFVADPLGLVPLIANRSDVPQLSGFDMTWGSGNHFFSQDHRSILIVADPVVSAVDYKFAEKLMSWTRQHADAIASSESAHEAKLRIVPAGAYVYAEQDHKYIEENIKRVSMISIVANVLLCLLIYPRIPLLLLSLLPTSLGILWTTGIASFYPGEVNLISLSFIAILAGLGDDQIVHFFNRVPQEWAKGTPLKEAVLHTFQSTGLSIVFCTLTAAIATAALATSHFKALAEFGFILTVGMFMMMLHTLITVPALMQLWWRVSKARAPEKITFRVLPSVARSSIAWMVRHARLVAPLSAALFLASCWMLPHVRLDKRFEVISADNPAVRAQRELSERFGIQGTPNVLLVVGDLETVLERSEALTDNLRIYQRRGTVRSIYSPSMFLPSQRTQQQRAQAMGTADYAAAALSLEQALTKGGLAMEPHRPYLERLRSMKNGVDSVTAAKAISLLPAGLLDNSLRRMQDGKYVAAIAFYPTKEGEEGIPLEVMRNWHQQHGPFFEFSFDKINSDLQSRILNDSKKAILWTALGVTLVVLLTFRSFRDVMLVMMPIVFAIVSVFGLLAMAGHHFSFMCVTAIPLILGIGIDNGIHVVRRYRENQALGILPVAQASGAAVIQSNLTTILGFGALVASSFPPLAELGLVTALGVGMALVSGLWLMPVAIHLLEEGQKTDIL